MSPEDDVSKIIEIATKFAKELHSISYELNRLQGYVEALEKENILDHIYLTVEVGDDDRYIGCKDLDIDTLRQTAVCLLNRRIDLIQTELRMKVAKAKEAFA
jgi:hypothetical protein